MSNREAVFRRRIDMNHKAIEIQEDAHSHHRRKNQTNQYGTARWNQNFSTQDIFLCDCIKNKVRVDILMKNDSLRTGRIESYDNWSLLLSYEDKKCLLFKSGIIAIIPHEQSYEIEDLNFLHRHTVSDVRAKYPQDPA